MAYEVLVGSVLDKIKEIESESVDSVITSPPYFGLRDYGNDEQIGLEETPEEYIQKMVDVFREVHRVLKPTGTVWLNIGDSYWQSGKNKHDIFKQKDLMMMPHRLAIALQDDGWYVRQDIVWAKSNPMPEAVKDRCTKAHEYIFLLTKEKKYYYNHNAILEPTISQTRSKKSNSKKSKYGSIENESKHRQGMTKERGSNLVEIRPLLPNQSAFVSFIRQTPKSELYEKTEIKHTTIDHWYRDDAWFNYPSISDWKTIYPLLKGEGIKEMNNLLTYVEVKTDSIKESRKGLKNKRSVWNVNTKPFKKAHFAVYPPELIEPCVLTTPTKVCVGCGKGYVEQMIVEKVLTLEEVEKIRAEIYDDSKEIKPYSVKEKEFRNRVVEFRNLPHHDIIREYLQKWRKNAEMTIKEVELHFGDSAGHHWFEKDGNYPTVEHWLELKSLFNFDDSLDLAMTQVFYKSGLKGDNDYASYGFVKDCNCNTDETKPAVILDIFAGSGTTGGVAEKHGRDSILIELNPKYAGLIPERIKEIVGE